MEVMSGQHILAYQRESSCHYVILPRRVCAIHCSSLLLLAGSFSAHAAEEMLRKAVGKGAYEMAYSQQENALWSPHHRVVAGQRRGGLPS